VTVTSLLRDENQIPPVYIGYLLVLRRYRLSVARAMISSPSWAQQEELRKMQKHLAKLEAVYSERLKIKEH